ncbi:MAG: hypothetical protein IJR77_02205 [Bacteroidales bacterium]|nr:hypothetical protein [Bacteroidales bacterium]
MISLDIAFSPDQMYRMLYAPFEHGCPVQLRTLTDVQIEQIPIMRQVLHLMERLSSDELKLTAKGYIPPILVEELYEMGEHSWNTDWFKQKSEPKTEEIQVLKVVLKECGLIKTRTGKMSLTSKGKKLLPDRNELMRTVMLFLMQDYNTGWLDLYEDMEVGNVGRLYSVWLLHKYGGEWRHTDFYTAEYAKAFPMLSDYRAYGHRVFNRLFRLIGLCRVNERPEDRGPGWGRKVIKTDVLDMLFEFEDEG